MRSLLLLTWRYLSFHRMRTLTLSACIALVLFLPLSVQWLIGHYSRTMAARAAATPLVIGRLGSRYDLVLNALYFKGEIQHRMTMSEAHGINRDGLGTAVPLYANHTAKAFPIIGTSPDYYPQRGLVAQSGTLPLKVGDAVLGAGVAAALGLEGGDTLLSDTRNLYDISKSSALMMSVTGVLAPTGSADDRAIFVDVKTAWVIDGLGHGHDDVTVESATDQVLSRDDGNVVANASVVRYRRITPENIDSFHFHGDPGAFPVSSILVFPRDRKSSTLLKGRYRVSEEHHAIVPTEALDEIMDLVVRIKRFFDMNTILVSAAAGLFLLLVILLTLRIRQRELETLFRIGCGRLTVFWLQTTELGLVILAGIVTAGVLSAFLALVVVRSGSIL
ncbi:MAG: hypothetical protein CMJ18_13715 [Phycisphaeraceae bacterium]|nr:hypothetical protein [Phycisphaeraceae bacterium]